MLLTPSPLPPSPLCAFGHIASAAELLADFGQESALAPFRRNIGTVRHPRTGLYVCAHLDERELDAAWCGGPLDCVSVLADLGLPVSDGGTPHLRLRRGDGRAAQRLGDRPGRLRAHWSRPRTPLPSAPEVRRLAGLGHAVDRLRLPAQEALRQALATCLPAAHAVYVIEAAVNGGILSADEVAAALSATSQRVQLALRSFGLSAQVEESLAKLTSGNRAGD